MSLFSGYKYAMILMVTTLALFVRKYKIECSSKSIHDVKTQALLTMGVIDEDLTCTLTPRENVLAK